MVARLFVSRFLHDDSGTTAIEYGLIIALIFLASVSSITLFGNKTTSLISKMSVAIGAAIG